MIRKLLNGDVDRVADIWLKTNLKAHYFISNRYWTSNYELVKEMVSQSEVYVFEAEWRSVPLERMRSSCGICNRMEKREKHKGCSCGEYLL